MEMAAEYSIYDDFTDDYEVDALKKDDQSKKSKVLHGKQSFSCSAAAAQTPPDDGVSEQSCLISVDHFSYINNVYKKEIKQIEKKNKSRILVHVNVTFESDQTDGKPNEALSDFTELLQSYSADSRASVVPLKFVDPDQWSEALKVIQTKKNKLFLTLSSEEMTVRGPSQSKEAFSETLNATQKTNAPSKPASQNTSLRTDASYWEHCFDPVENYNKRATKTKDKSDLDHKESSPNKRDINASYRKSVRNVDLKAQKKLHWDTSLLTSTQLYDDNDIYGSQKNLTRDDQLNHIYKRHSLRKQKIKQISDASAGSRMNERCGSVDWRSDHQSCRSSKGPEFNAHSTLRNTDAPIEGEDETCPICLDSFTNKKQLKCKHEFCEECLQKAIKHNGPICPICKGVFGVMEGDQPDGTMTWVTRPSSLPGFPGCGHILVTYDIPSGKQTDRHPKPGQPYSETERTAYLPDNNEGNKVLKLLRKAFDQKLIFTVGTSRTTGLENQVVWNDISHKTSMSGGSEGFGYPDLNYLNRVQEELKAKGIQ